MLNLSSTQKLQIITSSGADIDVHATYVDAPTPTTSTSDMTPSSLNTAITIATTTDVVASPAASTIRNVKLLTVRNIDASTSNDITVMILDSAGADPTLFKCTLAAAEELVMNEGVFFHYDIYGGVYGQLLPTASDTVVGGIEIAVQSEMESGTSTTQAVTPGRQHYHPGHPKAWLSCGVAADIQQSYNITSLADTGTGVVTITIATDFGATNFCIVASVEATATTWAVANAREVHIRNATRAVGSVALDCIDNTATTNLVKDPTTYHCIMMGDHA